MNVKIKFTEQSQTVAELRQEISRLETKVRRTFCLFKDRQVNPLSSSSFKNSELLAEGELRSNMDESDRVRDLQDRVAELKAEVRIGKSPVNLVNNLFRR